jgi:hypothetical protein
MADIKQAAKWMQEGKIVKRSGEDWVAVGLEKKEDPMKVRVVLCLVDLLAKDWEITEL